MRFSRIKTLITNRLRRSGHVFQTRRKICQRMISISPRESVCVEAYSQQQSVGWKVKVTELSHVYQLCGRGLCRAINSAKYHVTCFITAHGVVVLSMASVCLSACLPVRALTFEILDLETSFLATFSEYL